MRSYTEINEELNEFKDSVNTELDKFVEENNLRQNDFVFVFCKNGVYLKVYYSRIVRELFDLIEARFGKIVSIEHDLNVFTLKLEM